jgi:hypothetical protein
MCETCKWDCEDCTEEEYCKPCSRKMNGEPTDSNGDLIGEPDY